MAKKKFVVGTRDSILARLQTDLVLKILKEKFSNLEFEIIAVKTSGDKILHKPLAELGGRGVFVKELEESLLRKEVDFVVHSLKDLPTEIPQHLNLAATINRADPRDVLLGKSRLKFNELPSGSRVATSSRRRAAQLAAIRTDIQFVDIRGNIQTRLRKLEEGQCDAMILAAAGLERLELADRISQYFEPDECVPAVGQGALGIECHEDNNELLLLLEQINDEVVWACTSAERALLNQLGGGCSVPVGALAQMLDDGSGRIELRAVVASMDGKQVYRAYATGTLGEAESMGKKLAEELSSQGAGAVIESLLNQNIGEVSPP